MTEKIDGKRSCLKRISGYDTGEEGCESRYMLDNDKNNVIADKNFFCYFW